MNRAIVVDTNIIVSALLSPEGTAFEFMTRVLDGEYTVLVSEEIFREYEDVLRRDRFGLGEDIINYILNWFIDHALWVEPQQSCAPMPDEKDRIFYDVAKSCRARLITGNFKHYPVDECVTALWELKDKQT